MTEEEEDKAISLARSHVHVDRATRIPGGIRIEGTLYGEAAELFEAHVSSGALSIGTDNVIDVEILENDDDGDGDEAESLLRAMQRGEA